MMFCSRNCNINSSIILNKSKIIFTSNSTNYYYIFLFTLKSINSIYLNVNILFLFFYFLYKMLKFTF